MTEILPVPPKKGSSNPLDLAGLRLAVQGAERALASETSALLVDASRVEELREGVRLGAREWDAGQKELEEARTLLSTRKEDLAQMQVSVFIYICCF